MQGGKNYHPCAQLQIDRMRIGYGTCDDVLICFSTTDLDMLVRKFHIPAILEINVDSI